MGSVGALVKEGYMTKTNLIDYETKECIYFKFNKKVGKRTVTFCYFKKNNM